MLSVDSIIFFVLAIYKDSVEQSEYGGFKSLFLCAYPSYWRNKKTNRQTSITNILCENTNNTFEMEQEDDIEIVSNQLEAEIILALIVMTLKKWTFCANRNDAKQMDVLINHFTEGLATSKTNNIIFKAIVLGKFLN